MTTREGVRGKCPECNGPAWDNRAENDARQLEFKRMRPDRVCKDTKGCKWVMWRARPNRIWWEGAHWGSDDDREFWAE